VSLTREEVIRYLDGLPSDELGALADEVLARLGMTPPPVPEERHVIGGMSVQEMFDVVLRGHGADKVSVIQAVRRVLGPSLGLSEAKRLVDSAPVRIAADLYLTDARALADALRAAGADVEIR
jgi:large subunit ribosomal protein L7/L12